MGSRGEMSVKGRQKRSVEMTWHGQVLFCQLARAVRVSHPFGIQNHAHAEEDVRHVQAARGSLFRGRESSSIEKKADWSLIA